MARTAARRPFRIIPGKGVHRNGRNNKQLRVLRYWLPSETVAAPPSKQADVNGGSLSYAELYKKLNPKTANGRGT